LDFLVNTTITNAINKDRFSKFITVDECILYLLEIMKLLRNEYATEKGRKDVLTELRMKAIAAYIAKNVFKLKKEIKNPETISVKKYAHKANSAARILTDGQKDFFTYYPPRSE
jgi:hypothetical protein